MFLRLVIIPAITSLSLSLSASPDYSAFVLFFFFLSSFYKLSSHLSSIAICTLKLVKESERALDLKGGAVLLLLFLCLNSHRKAAFFCHTAALFLNFKR